MRPALQKLILYRHENHKNIQKNQALNQTIYRFLKFVHEHFFQRPIDLVALLLNESWDSKNDLFHQKR